MKRFLSRGLCLALGMSPAFVPLAASSQELNFRAVAPRPAVTDEIPITLSRPTALDPSTPIFRGKVQDDGGIVIQAEPVTPNTPRMMPKDAPRVNPLPTGSPTDFVPPAPQLIAPPPGTVVTPGTTYVPGTSYPGTAPGSVVVGSSPAESGHVVSGTVSTGGCNSCSGGGFSLYDTLFTEEGLDGCGLGCSSCGHGCQPIAKIRDFFSFCWCNGGCCDPRTPFWARAEYLLWDVSQQNIPPLVTSAANPLQTPLGAGSSVLFDKSGQPSAIQNGVRIGLGFWFPRHNDWGMDASYFVVGDRNGSFTSVSNGNPATGRPFQNVTGGSPGFADAQLVAVPGTPGSVTVDTNTRLSGGDINLRRKLCCGPGYWIDGLIGYRHMNLEDSVSVLENIGPRTGVLSDGVTTFNTQRSIVNDSFATTNVFNGGQLGLEAEWRFRPRFTLGGSLKVAAGNMHQTLTINGGTTVYNVNNLAASQQGGLLAQGTNIGQYSVDRFVVVPEVGIKLGWDITRHWRFYAGYNVLYVSNVMRAGDQIDLNVNRSQFPFQSAAVRDANGFPARGTLTPGTPASPSVPFRTSEFWAQGVNLGLEYRY